MILGIQFGQNDDSDLKPVWRESIKCKNKHYLKHPTATVFFTMFMKVPVFAHI